MNVFLKYLSWIYPLKIRKTGSEYNPHLVVKLHRGRLQLNAKRANYSFGNIHRLWHDAIRAEYPKISTAENILILGFGAGSILEHLRTNFHYNGPVEAVEIDPEVIHLYKNYFAKEYHAPITILTRDAFEFIAESKSRYDYIFVDLFKDLDLLEETYSKNFIKHCKSLLQPQGKLIINTISNSKDDFKRIQEFVLDLSISFKDVSITPYQSFNHIIKCK